MDKFFLVIMVSFASLMCSCGHMSEKNGRSIDNMTDSVISDSVSNNNARINLFGIETEKEEVGAIRNLAAAGILKIDSISLENNKFKFAIIEFAGVKFGLNSGFSFITSKHDTATINALVQYISKYYGEPEIDDNGDPAYNYYHWNHFGQNRDSPYIRIRPTHSDEGGLTMFWEL